MKKLILTLLICLPVSAFAGHLDVIEFELTDSCTLDEYLQIAKDFNEQWAADKGYSSRIAVPIQSDNLTSLFWVGTSESTAAFGAAWDTWRDELSDPDSIASKLWVRFQACSVNIKRTAYDFY